MIEDKVYQEILSALRGFIEGHECPSNGKKSVQAFCTEYGINRPNLVFTLNGNKDMSVGLFMRVCVPLGLIEDEGQLALAGQLDTMPLRLYLKVNYSHVMKAVLGLNYGSINSPKTQKNEV